jgi:uncharacterized protein
MTGLGGGILLFAFMTPLFPPAVLIPLHGIIQLMSNSSRVILSYKKVNFRIFILFALGAGVGSAFGAPLSITIPQFFSTIIIAAAILFFTWFPKIIKAVNVKGVFLYVGAIASFLSLFIGSTGPLTAPFFLNSELDKESFVPTKAACQIPIHLFKVIVFIFSGFILSEWFIEIVVAIPMVFSGAYIGKKLVGKLDEGIYRNVIKVVITVLVIRMLVKLVI